MGLASQFAAPMGILVRHVAVGVNFMDICIRRGRSPIPIQLPGGLGGRAALALMGWVQIALRRIAYAGGGARRICRSDASFRHIWH